MVIVCTLCIWYDALKRFISAKRLSKQIKTQQTWYMVYVFHPTWYCIHGIAFIQNFRAWPLRICNTKQQLKDIGMNRRWFQDIRMEPRSLAFSTLVNKILITFPSALLMLSISHLMAAALFASIFATISLPDVALLVHPESNWWPIFKWKKILHDVYVNVYVHLSTGEFNVRSSWESTQIFWRVASWYFAEAEFSRKLLMFYCHQWKFSQFVINNWCFSRIVELWNCYTSSKETVIAPKPTS